LCRTITKADVVFSWVVNTNWLRQIEASVTVLEYLPPSSETRRFRKVFDAPQHKARTAFYAHFFSSLIVRSQTGECSTIVNVSLYSDDINADLFSYLTLNIPARNVLTIAKKPTTKFPDRLIKNAV
jgi:hypothetical protein